MANIQTVCLSSHFTQWMIYREKEQCVRTNRRQWTKKGKHTLGDRKQRAWTHKGKEIQHGMETQGGDNLYEGGIHKLADGHIILPKYINGCRTEFTLSKNQYQVASIFLKLNIFLIVSV